MKKNIAAQLCCVFMLCYSSDFSQTTPRALPAKRTTQHVKIDGVLNDSAWKDAAMMTDLIEFRPRIGAREPYADRTEAWLMYDDEGIYFGGYCHEATKDSISRELAGRDGFGANDYVGIIFDTYYDKLNGFEYFVTPLNEQEDAKMSPPSNNGNSEDFTWNAVWKSGAVIHDDGWSFEMFIPYSAIRFSKKKLQTWGFNITRRRRKTEQQYTWNPIDPNINGFLTQEALWTNITDIKPPLRLQFSPYFSTYVNHFPYRTQGIKDWTSSVNGGMDVKYGISQAITLDMTLIPDFGQVQSDYQVLNLTPFEVKFNENRSFFTEGTELFGKGNLFYSRRVGGTPLHFYDVPSYLYSDEHIVKNPTETKLINATKISGRLKSGLGIGFFNALTSPQYAVVSDDSSHERKIQTSPLTNYNIIVLNQSLKHNSSVTFINTDVLRSGSDYDANVSAALFDLNDKTNTWNVGGKIAHSDLFGYLPDNKTQSGYNHSVYFGKTSGNFNFQMEEDLTDDKFSSNDLGYFTVNNFFDHTLWMQYHWLKPTKWYNNLRINFNAYYSRRFTPSAYQMANFNVNSNAQLKNIWFVGVLLGYDPHSNDFYEPRTAGRVFKHWGDWFVDWWIQTDQSKKYSAYTEMLYVARDQFKGKRFLLTFRHQYRFNNKFSITHSLSMEPQPNNVGYAATDSLTSDIIFGRRNRNTIENILEYKYSFNSKMRIRARFRHYWSKVDYKEYFTLTQDGDLAKNSTFTGNANDNVNFWNVDMTYTWEFSPGSFLNIVWKDAAFNETAEIEKLYFKNLSNTIQSDQNNNFSVKVIYFLDYLEFKKWRKKK